MRAVVQRVRHAEVTVEGRQIGAIGKGLAVLLGVGHGDSDADVTYMARKISGLRVFEDPDGRMSRSVHDVGGEVLVVSQFTLFGDVRKGRRPSFTAAMEPDEARRRVDEVCEALRAIGLEVATGEFAAMMDVSLTNDGPVTIMIDSKKTF